MKTKASKTIFRVMLGLLAAAIVGGCLYLNSLMPIITGYAAKNLASAVFVSGRDQADVEALDLHFSFIKFNRNQVDYENKTVTSRFLWAKSTAVYREGYGVTLLRGKTVQELQAEKYPLAIENGLLVLDSLSLAHTTTLSASEDSALCSRLEPLAKALVDDRSYNGTPFAFIVLHEGRIVAERYREGITPETRLLSWSMGKSVTSALTGCMVEDGLVDLYAPMDIPEWQGDDRKRITLNDLLQMQSGLQWNENYGTRSDVNLMLHREKDMGLFALSKPLEHQPGTYWYYSSGTTNIVMRYLRSRFASDAEFLAYLRDEIFAPLGIRNPCFEPDMSGTPVGSSYLYMTARDFARFGQLYLDGGHVGDLRIFPEGWVEYSAAPASGSQGEYGAFFWLNRGGKYPDAPADMFECRGHDGQEIFILPSQDLVVVVLGYSPKPDHVIEWNRLLKDILAALG